MKKRNKSHENLFSFSQIFFPEIDPETMWKKRLE